MISLKKFLNQDPVTPPAEAIPVSAPARAEIAVSKLESAVSAKAIDSTSGNPAWRTLLMAISDSAETAIPPLGPAIRQKLSALNRESVSPTGGRSLASINESVCLELSNWSGEAAKFYGEHQSELKEIISVVARTAEAIGNRDDRYTEEIGGFATKLRTVATQSDLTVIRKSIMESAGAVQTCVARMAKEGKETVRQLSAQTEEYRRRMEDAEKISLTDPLTGVLNRRGLDQNLAHRVEMGRPFFVILLDLDKFKSINDRYGHAAGDDLLRQFAAELIAQFRTTDAVARLGGDEFVAVVAGHASEAEALAAKIRSWVMGKYRLCDANNEKIEAEVHASFGIASWNGKETVEALLARADGYMYESKAAGQAKPASLPVASGMRREAELVGA